MARIERRVFKVSAGDVLVRTATEADGDGITRLFVTTAGETSFLTRDPDEIQRDPEMLRSWLQTKLASESDLLLVAELEQQVVAIAGLTGSKLRRFRHSAELAIAVLKDHWGCGIGRYLTERLLEWADNSALQRVYLEVSDDNTRAIHLYESLGFEVEGRLRARRKHGEVYVDNLAMARVRV